MALKYHSLLCAVPTFAGAEKCVDNWLSATFMVRCFLFSKEEHKNGLELISVVELQSGGNESDTGLMAAEGGHHHHPPLTQKNAEEPKSTLTRTSWFLKKSKKTAEDCRWRKTRRRDMKKKQQEVIVVPITASAEHLRRAEYLKGGGTEGVVTFVISRLQVIILSWSCGGDTPPIQELINICRLWYHLELYIFLFILMLYYSACLWAED